MERAHTAVAMLISIACRGRSLTLVRRLGFACLAGLLLIATSAQSRAASGPSRPYLLSTGPTTLRFSKPDSIRRPARLDPLTLQAAISASNLVEQVSELDWLSNNGTFFSSLFSGMTNIASTEVLPLPMEGPETIGMSEIGASASDVLLITPQMLSEYFKPVVGVRLSATNALPQGAPRFEPPVAYPLPGSKAVYRSP